MRTSSNSLDIVHRWVGEGSSAVESRNSGIWHIWKSLFRGTFELCNYIIGRSITWLSFSTHLVDLAKSSAPTSNIALRQLVAAVMIRPYRYALTSTVSTTWKPIFACDSVLSEVFRRKI